MASFYKVATGHDVASGSLVLISPQPRSDGVQSTRRLFSANAKVKDEGLFVYLHWNVIGTIAMYQSILSQFGLGAATEADVTISVPEYQYAYNRFNGVAIRPAPGEDVQRRNFFFREIVILVRNLEYAS